VRGPDAIFDNRLPRMRGDRPNTIDLLRHGEVATPHARGSTCARLDKDKHVCGYPACAGIDLSPQGLTVLHCGLPRMRGDRPLPGQLLSQERWATPHARGSTPSFDSIAGTWARLPRMRGDRPEAEARSLADIQATPHARGSTHAGRLGGRGGEGYPACAGIDLTRSF